MDVKTLLQDEAERRCQMRLWSSVLCPDMLFVFLDGSRISTLLSVKVARAKDPSHLRAVLHFNLQFDLGSDPHVVDCLALFALARVLAGSDFDPAWLHGFGYFSS